MMFDDPNWNHEYPPSHLGTIGYRRESEKLLFGADSPLIESGRYVRFPGSGLLFCYALRISVARAFYSPIDPSPPTHVPFNNPLSSQYRITAGLGRKRRMPHGSPIPKAPLRTVEIVRHASRRLHGKRVLG